LRNDTKIAEFYSELYKQKAFDVWFLNGRPTDSNLYELLSPDEQGNKPSYPTLVRWRKDFDWESRADILDAQAIQKHDDALIQKKVEMLTRHYNDAVSLATKAKEHLMMDGFDSSAAAVNAYFRGTEEQRNVEGLGELLNKLGKMTNEQISALIFDNIRRMSANDQVIDVPLEEKEDEQEYEN
jgi:hypothetical protein